MQEQEQVDARRASVNTVARDLEVEDSVGTAAHVAGVDVAASSSVATASEASSLQRLVKTRCGATEINKNEDSDSDKKLGKRKAAIIIELSDDSDYENKESPTPPCPAPHPDPRRNSGRLG